MPSMYPNLSDEQLLGQLRLMAAERYGELVEEEEAGTWSVGYRRSDVPEDPGPDRGVWVLKAESDDLRSARESLLFMAESS